MAKRGWWTLREAFASADPQHVAQRQRMRLADIVAHARYHSPYYRDLYRGLPERVEDSRVLPVTSKQTLMARFDEWATDRDISINKARAFAETPQTIGERFLGRYTLASTSGTTGYPGIFIIDDRSMSVTNALALRMVREWLSAADFAKILARRGRVALQKMAKCSSQMVRTQGSLRRSFCD